MQRYISQRFFFTTSLILVLCFTAAYTVLRLSDISGHFGRIRTYLNNTRTKIVIMNVELDKLQKDVSKLERGLTLENELSLEAVVDYISLQRKREREEEYLRLAGRKI